jgi:hypothetical protein
MPKKKMTFPAVPGDTVRERFVNLVRHIFTVSKAPTAKATATTRKQNQKKPETP